MSYSVIKLANTGYDNIRALEDEFNISGSEAYIEVVDYSKTSPTVKVRVNGPMSWDQRNILQQNYESIFTP